MQKPPRHLLSKSTFMYGCQCPKRLWLHKFMPMERDEQDEAQTAFFQQGTDIGLLAQQRFPNGVDASPETFFEYQKSVVKTAELIEAGETIIYEAAFQYNGILCAIDILVKEKNKWYAYEVKSSTSAKDTFVKDAALQYYVITNSGIELEDIFILHLNSDYVRYGELDLNELFTPTSVKDQVLDLQPFIKQKELELKNVLKLNASPEIKMGTQCNKPYDCDFIGYCSKSIETVLPDFGEENIDMVAIQEFVDQLKYPLYFMDFETWSSPIPEQDGHWPYRQIPFQFSLHIQKEPNAEVEHFEYLAENTESSLEDFANALFKNIGDEGSVVVYNQTFENMILNQLKDDIEDAKEAIENIQSRFFDLMYPFRKKYYYTPKMQGSYSIKYVLPALIPELQYSDLEIGNGGDASAAFYNLKNEKNLSKVIEIRNALLEYCKLDTFAMVKILEKIKIVA
jgi:hypothetical protein